MATIHFPNRSGEHLDTDNVLCKELRYAGIPGLWDSTKIKEADVQAFNWTIRRGSGRVRTAIYGELYGWSFARCSTYWEAAGPGLDVENAKRLYDKHGTLQPGCIGDAQGPSPMAHYRGLACGYYHVDTFEGLRALADTIKIIVEGPKPLKVMGITIPILSEARLWLSLR